MLLYFYVVVWNSRNDMPPVGKLLTLHITDRCKAQLVQNYTTNDFNEVDMRSYLPKKTVIFFKAARVNNIQIIYTEQK